MNLVESQNIKWQLVGEENGKQIASFNCPNEIIGDIVTLLFKADQGKTFMPTPEILDFLRKYVQENELNIQIITEITDIDKEYIYRLIDGVIEPLDTDKFILLAKFLDKKKNKKMSQK